MQSETRQKADCGSAPRKWNGTEGGHTKHGRRTNFNLLTAEHSLPHLFSKRRKSIFPKNRQRTISPGKTGRKQFLSKTGRILVFSKEKRKLFFQKREKDTFPETGRKTIHKSKKESGGDKGPPQAGCSGMTTEMFIMSCFSEGEGETAAVCWRKHAAAKPRAPDRSIPGKTPFRALSRGVDRHPRGG